MALQNFTVVFSKSNPKGGFLTKIQTKGITTINQGIFGSNNRETSQTYYVFGTNQMSVGQQIQVDVDLYHIKTRTDYANPTTGEIIPLKYLVGLK